MKKIRNPVNYKSVIKKVTVFMLIDRLAKRLCEEKYEKKRCDDYTGLPLVFV